MKTHKTEHATTSISYNTVQDIVDTCNKIIHSNPTASITLSGFTVEMRSEYGDDFPVLSYYLPETDKERERREKRDLEWAASREKYERQQLEQLKKKYGTNE